MDSRRPDCGNVQATVCRQHCVVHTHARGCESVTHEHALVWRLSVCNQMTGSMQVRAAVGLLVRMQMHAHRKMQFCVCAQT
jgi:hypothetical protein